MVLSKKEHRFYKECIKDGIKDRIKRIKILKIKYKPIISELEGVKNKTTI